MGTQKVFSGFVVGLLVLMGGFFALPFAGSAQQDGTPPAQDAAADAADDAAEGANSPIVGTPLFDPAIGLVEAQELALAGQDGAVVLSVELEGDDGVLVYAVALDNGIETDIDATTGAVIKSESSDDGKDDGDQGEAEDGDDQDDGGEDENGDDDDNDDDDEDEDEGGDDA